METNMLLEDCNSEILKQYSNNIEFIILPANWNSDTTTENYNFFETTYTVEKLLKSQGLKTEIIGNHHNAYFIYNRNIEWIAPAIFVSSALISQNPFAVSIAINVISTYLTDIFKGISIQPKVRINLYLEGSEGEIKKATYEGPASGLKEFHGMVKDLK